MSFLWQGRNYRFKRLPFGLNISFSSFIKALHHVLQYLVSQGFLKIYVDDIFISSRKFQDHCRHLKLLFQRFTDFNVTVNLAKSIFIQNYSDVIKPITDLTRNKNVFKWEQMSNRLLKNPRDSSWEISLCTIPNFHCLSTSQPTPREKRSWPS